MGNDSEAAELLPRDQAESNNKCSDFYKKHRYIYWALGTTGAAAILGATAYLLYLVIKEPECTSEEPGVECYHMNPKNGMFCNNTSTLCPTGCCIVPNP